MWKIQFNALWWKINQILIPNRLQLSWSRTNPRTVAIFTFNLMFPATMTFNRMKFKAKQTSSQESNPFSVTGRDKAQAQSSHAIARHCLPASWSIKISRLPVNCLPHGVGPPPISNLSMRWSAVLLNLNNSSDPTRIRPSQIQTIYFDTTRTWTLCHTRLTGLA